MHRLTLECSPPSCLPGIHDIFADGEAVEPMKHHDECKSSASYCSESTRSISSHSACDDSQWYIVQDFEAGGGNLGLYLLGRENTIFDVPENGGIENGDHESNSSNELFALAKASRVALTTMQESEIRSLARSLLLALNELHRRSICHNNLCPENILVPILPTNRHIDKEPKQYNSEEVYRQNKQRENCRTAYSYRHSRHRRRQSFDESLERCWEDLKLCDLGRSFFVNKSPRGVTSPANTVDAEIAQHSSIHYTSPEVIRGKPPDLASDMWSVGVILYRCFAGEVPFRERSDENTRLTYSSTVGPKFSSSPSKAAAMPAPKTKSMLREQLKRDICRADCNFGQSNRRKTDLRWSRVSRGAKQFLSALLNPSPSRRMTCDEALYHPWLMKGTPAKGFSPSSSPMS